MPTMQLQTPILRMATAIFCYLGFHLKETHWSRPRSVLLLIWNLAMNGLILYGTCTLDLFRPMLLDTCTSVKPLFVFFVDFCILYFYPAVFIINVFYNLIFNTRIMRHLDSICFYRVNHSEQRSRRQLIYLLIMTHIGFAMAVLYRLTNQQSARDEFLYSPWTAFHVNLCLYAVNVYQISLCLIVHYYQSATLRLLKRTEANVSAVSVLADDEDAALAEISALATANFKLNRLLSLPLIIYIVINAINIFLALCVSLICGANLSLMVHSLAIWVYLAYLVGLNREILCTLKRIVTRLKRNYDSDLGQGAMLSARPQVYDDSTNRRRQLRFTQMDLYFQYFPIKIFHFTKMSFPFILKTVLFIFNYVVLMTQTN